MSGTPKDINPLICSPSPRDIEQVIEERYRIPHDQFWVKYVHAPRAYSIIRDFFLGHEQYTHLVMCPDDLLVNHLHINQLISDINEGDWPVISGVCNVDLVNRNRLAACKDKLPTPERYGRVFDFISLSEAIIINGIIKVVWMGFPAAFIRRDIVEQIPFKSDSKANNIGPQFEGFSFDVMFCNDCKDHQIPIMVDTRVMMDHLKPSNEGPDIRLIGKKAPVTIWKHGEQTKITPIVQ